MAEQTIRITWWVKVLAWLLEPVILYVVFVRSGAYSGGGRVDMAETQRRVRERLRQQRLDMRSDGRP